MGMTESADVLAGFGFLAAMTVALAGSCVFVWWQAKREVRQSSTGRGNQQVAISESKGGNGNG